MRLAKYLAHAGVASRRAAEDIVRAGRVCVDDVVVLDPARDVDADTSVSVDGRLLGGAEARVVYILHKPQGVVSTARDTHRRPTVVDLVGFGDARLYPVGRLDADTTGLILLTNDGALAQSLLHPRYEVARTYRATVGEAPVTPGALRRLRDGVVLEDGLTAPARVRRLAPDVLELTLHEGRKRQVRRMCEAVGHPVRQLTRTAFGPLGLGELACGQSRQLTAVEIEALHQAGGPTVDPASARARRS